jgi:hypothetical protein
LTTSLQFEAFIEQAWADHADRPEEVAVRLEQGYSLIESPAQIASLARILAHVDGEHLARWSEGVARLERLRGHAHWRAEGDAAVLVRRLIAALRLGEGAPTDPGLSPPDRAHAHALAASALAAQQRVRDALRHYRTARGVARAGIADGDPAIRALAVTSNNLAATLEASAGRNADETIAMLDAAVASREYWARAGGWLEAERAEFMLAQCHLAAGDAASALGHAEACAAICDRNGADAFERFFAQGVTALAHRALGDHARFEAARAAARSLRESLPAEQLPWCDPMLQRLA